MPHDHESQYDLFASEFAEHAVDSPYNAHYDRPEVLELLGDVRGLRVLDAGCGPGIYAEELLARGATVTAFDSSAEMVALARERVGRRADVRAASLERGLTWLTAGSQDAALMALVIHHIDDRALALGELYRVLRPGGRLVVSTVHPTDDWLRTGGSYFDRELIDEVWKRGWRVRYWRQPLSAWCREFAEAGFLIERITEPLPCASMAERYPEAYDKLRRAPAFIAFRLVKPSPA